jgi:RimJ/RimL family protein N-acetyltransferase
MKLDKAQMFETLPIAHGDVCLRAWDRADLDHLAAWPSYPFPYEPFNLSYGRMTPAEREAAFQTRDTCPNRITLVADHQRQRTIAFVALAEIDWEGLAVGNMGFRVHPSWCGQGVGAAILRTVVNWCFDWGVQTLRLDVAASNARAIRCYEKCGFFINGTFWRDAPELAGLDISTPLYDFLRPHVRVENGVSQLRFWWMQISRTPSSEPL